jgi:hypothetical protein
MDLLTLNAAKQYANSIAFENGAVPVPGIPGAPGKEGPPGQNGRDGTDGVAGRDGVDGVNGRDGRDGIDGANGIDGRDGQDGQNAVLNIEYRGLHVEGNTYFKDDVAISLETGHGYTCVVDETQVPPNAETAEWRLWVQQGAPGRDGKDGRDGTDGKDGLEGKDGENGTDGRDGKNGENGRDGTDGRDGQDGASGKDGTPGKDGIDGLDGEGSEFGKIIFSGNSASAQLSEPLKLGDYYAIRFARTTTLHIFKAMWTENNYMSVSFDELSECSYNFSLYSFLISVGTDRSKINSDGHIWYLSTEYGGNIVSATWGDSMYRNILEVIRLGGVV